MTTYLYGDRGSTQAVAAWKEAEATGLAIDQAIVRPPRRSAVRPRLHDDLSPGDMLVVDELGALGETYQEIVDATRELMRRKVLLRSMEDNLIFNGLLDTASEQASRDALIAHVAATAMDRKTARRAAQTRAALLVENPAEQWEGKAGRLQIRVIAGQLAAFAAAVYLLNFIGPGAHRRDIPDARSETFQAERNRALTLPPTRLETQEANAGARHLYARSDPYAVAADESRKNAATLGLSPQQRRLAYQTVVDWRSARVRSQDFKAEIGAIAPRRAHLAIFPRKLVAQAPSLRDYRFVVSDRRIAIVDPATRQVVGILDE
ncbi:DUF1236 domain-containing protein [Methylocystis sp. JAN1]|uniref:DUF1236 domain-containing protein n=1 Tax=Methylocystis sp. JAN1 TaxID=3397211 RepID=UPI003FA1E3A2